MIFARSLLYTHATVFNDADGAALAPETIVVMGDNSAAGTGVYDPPYTVEVTLTLQGDGSYSDGSNMLVPDGTDWTLTLYDLDQSGSIWHFTAPQTSNLPPKTGFTYIDSDWNPPPTAQISYL